MHDRVKEKLVELLNEASDILLETAGGLNNNHGNGIRADHLIANGVTVGKPLAEYLHPIVNYDGLKDKYLVFGATTGKRIVNCFVLRPDKDHAAVEALKAYARFTDNKTLSADIYNWVGRGEPVQQWIPVSDPPKKNGYYMCWKLFSAVGERKEYIEEILFYEDNMWLENARSFRKEYPLYWMPLPLPPKGE